MNNNIFDFLPEPPSGKVLNILEGVNEFIAKLNIQYPRGKTPFKHFHKFLIQNIEQLNKNREKNKLLPLKFSQLNDDVNYNRQLNFVKLAIEKDIIQQQNDEIKESMKHMAMGVDPSKAGILSKMPTAPQGNLPKSKTPSKLTSVQKDDFLRIPTISQEQIMQRENELFGELEELEDYNEKEKGGKKKKKQSAKKKKKKSIKTRKSTNKKKNKKTRSKKQKGGNRDYQLYFAALQGNVDIVINMLAQGADINKAWSIGLTPLLIASQKGHVNVVRVLLEHGADIDKAMNSGATPLFMASQNGHVDVVRVLVEQGADINKPRASNGCTPLYVASEKGHMDVVRMLLEQGADIDKANKNGYTPLLIASQNGHVDVVRVLLEHGADIDKANNNGITPLMIAEGVGHSEVATLLKRYKLLGPIVEKTVERQKDRKHFEEIMENKIFADLKNKHEIMQYLGGRRKTRKSTNKKKKQSIKKKNTNVKKSKKIRKEKRHSKKHKKTLKRKYIKN